MHPAAAHAAHRATVARSGADRVVLGVCGGIGAALRIDPVLLRLGVAAATFAGGFGLVAYLFAGILLPAPPPDGPPEPHPRPLQRALGLLALLSGLAVLLASIRSSAPTLLLLGGIAVVWRQAVPVAWNATQEGRVPAVARTVVGGLLLGGGVLTIIAQDGSLSAFASAAVAGAVVASGIGLLFGPAFGRARGEVQAERLERVRADERARVAARLHDSVLQTLALIQTTDDTQRSRALARRQERELRAWLYGGEDPDAATTFAGALRHAADAVEEDYEVVVALVQPGDGPLDAGLEALVAATREAMTNAAKHSGTAEISVLARIAPEEASVYVRDRGTGFRRDRIPADRRGIRDSIEQRLAGLGGRATIHTAPGEGTEIELLLPRPTP
ncbi:PspC domain-containing protein [Paraconexibacter sp. AEG42_29]|uniref:ATP-binding protein n=1 Tax=Paraconexibacter sp. AEG42_29 TaxID=2997339 RepID=UPI00339D6A1B